MKKYFLIILVIIFCFSCKAQSPIYSIEQYYGIQDNAYYKDTNNILNKFVGTWIYENGDTSLKITLLKAEQAYNGKCY
ncbi:MAG: hypothetical protein GYB32_01345 [Algicola sp.]|nr:hypothetical protein [Algicola sp.]